MLEKGRDTQGPQKTGLFPSALDRAALAPLTNRPAAPTGIRESDRVGAKDGALVGANLPHDENFNHEWTRMNTNLERTSEIALARSAAFTPLHLPTPACLLRAFDRDQR